MQVSRIASHRLAHTSIVAARRGCLPMKSYKFKDVRRVQREGSAALIQQIFPSVQRGVSVPQAGQAMLGCVMAHNDAVSVGVGHYPPNLLYRAC